MALFASKPNPRKLRDKLAKARQRERFDEALAILDELQKLEPKAPRWPHKRGDVLRRMGRNDEAVAAYEEAVERYAEEGFLARAVAMAKTIVSLNPERTDALQRLEPEAARELHRRQRPHAVSALSDPPRERKSILDAAGELSPASDTAADEIKFVTSAEDQGLEVDLSELEVGPREPSPAEETSSEEPPGADQLARLPLLPLFAEVPRQALVALAQGSELIELSHGQAVMLTGQPADALFGIVEGSVRVLVPGSPPDTPVVLAEGDVLGEACLLQDEPRHADVVVEGKLVALRMPKAVLNDLVRQYPAIGEVLLEMLARRLLQNLLHTSPLFMEFDAASRREVGRAFEIHRVPAGTRLLEAGKVSDGLYMPLTGKLRIEEPGGGEPVLAGYGKMLGQESLIGRKPSTVTACTETELIVLRLPRAAFAKVAMQFPTLLARMSELM